jgi:hypothetical protein
MLETTLTLAAICATMAAIIGMVLRRGDEEPHRRERQR